MNINPQYRSHDDSNSINSVIEMKGCMDIIKELAIDPMIQADCLDDDEKEVLDAVGVSLQLIAKKAKNFEDYVQENMSSHADEMNSYEYIFNYRN